MSAFIKQIRKIAANLKKSILLKLCTLVGQFSAKSCYAVGFLKYRVIIEKCANFDDATEAVILTLNFNPTSADSHRQTIHSIAQNTSNRLNGLSFVVFVNLIRVI